MKKKLRKIKPISLNKSKKSLFKKHSRNIRQKTNKEIFKITNREVDAIIDYLRQTKDFENILIFYFLFAKGLNYTQVSRILITDFKQDFNYLLLKKKFTFTYTIDLDIKNKLIEFFLAQEYESCYFFYNKIKDGENTRRSLFIKNKFTYIINNCFWINNQRKKSCINYFSLKRFPKWGYNTNKFIDNIYFSKNKSGDNSDSSSGPYLAETRREFMKNSSNSNGIYNKIGREKKENVLKKLDNNNIENNETLSAFQRIKKILETRENAPFEDSSSSLEFTNN